MKRKIMSKITACALALSLACVGFVMPAKKVSAASAQPVQLYYAQTLTYMRYGNYQGDVSVENLDYNKQVIAHYYDGAWETVNCSYVKDDPNNSGFEVWHFNLGNAGHITSLYVEYDVNGQTYYDNNGGKNYSLDGAYNYVALGKDTVKFAYGDTWKVIAVKNLGYDKKVTVRYTTDNWATSTDVDATYTYSPSSDVDLYNLPTTVPTGAQFAVSYTVNGVTYWDNNYGSNYVNPQL